MPPEPRPPLAVLTHPVVLAALAVWLVNDHWAKAAYPGFLTGKLSDAAGLVVFPLIPASLLALRRGRQPPGRQLPGRQLPGWCSATAFLLPAAALAAIKLLDPAAFAYRYGLAIAQWPLRAAWQAITIGQLPGLRPVQLTMDPSDLLTLPALLVPWILLRRQERGPGLLYSSPSRTPSRSRSSARRRPLPLGTQV